MFKEIPTIEKEKTREELLKEFESSLEKHGVEGVKIKIEEKEGKLKLVIEQKYGEGICGLGYDKGARTLWFCLDQNNPKETVRENNRWDANTVLNLENEYPGIKFEEAGEGIMKVTIAADHPVTAFANLNKKDGNVHLSGEFNNWDLEEPFKLNEETGELEGIVAWDGNGSIECKIAISDIKNPDIENVWEDGGWKDEANQKMEIDLGEEEAEDSK